MSDQSAIFAEFLVEEYRDIPTRHQPSVVRDRFPNIQHDEFMRGFAIAEEIAVAEAFEATA